MHLLFCDTAALLSFQTHAPLKAAKAAAEGLPGWGSPVPSRVRLCRGRTSLFPGRVPAAVHWEGRCPHSLGTLLGLCSEVCSWGPARLLWMSWDPPSYPCLEDDALRAGWFFPARQPTLKHRMPRRLGAPLTALLETLPGFTAIMDITSPLPPHHQLEEMSQTHRCHTELVTVNLDRQLPLLQMSFVPPQAAFVLNDPSRAQKRKGDKTLRDCVSPSAHLADLAMQGGF